MNYYITYFEIAAFIASLIAWGIIKKNKYLRLYPLLLFVVVSLEVYETFFRQDKSESNTWIYNIQIPLQYLIYMTILYYAFLSITFKRIIIFAALFFIVLCFISEMYLTRKGAFNSWSYSAGSVIVIIAILVKFYEMLQNSAEFNFTRNPFFYMLFAFLFFNIGTLPFFVMGNWLWFEKRNIELVIILQNVGSVLNYILYSTYTIAFIWMRKKGSC